MKQVWYNKKYSRRMKVLSRFFLKSKELPIVQAIKKPFTMKNGRLLPKVTHTGMVKWRRQFSKQSISLHLETKKNCIFYITFRSNDLFLFFIFSLFN